MQHCFILILVLTISYFLLKYYRTEGMQNCSKTTIYHFLYKYAALKYPDLIKEFGEPMTFLDQPHGAVIWKGTDIFETIMLLDEAIGHMEPYSHCDCVYATVRVHIPDNIVSIVLGLSKSINYDRLKKTLTVRCHSMPPCAATLWLAMNILENPAEADVIAKEYSNTIHASELRLNYLTMKDELKKMVRNNQTMYNKELEKQECVFEYGAGLSSSLLK